MGTVSHRVQAIGIRHIRTGHLVSGAPVTEAFLLKEYPDDFEQVRQSRTTEYGVWETWTCGPDTWGEHKGPWHYVDPYQDVEECEACGTQIGK